MNRSARCAVVTVGVLTASTGVLGLVLNLGAPLSRIEQPTRVSQLIYLCQPLLLGSLGCYLAVRRSRHPAGWHMLVAGVAVALESLGQGVQAGGRPVGWVPWAVWLEDWTWIAFLTTLPLLVFRFPDGRLPGPRWRLPARAPVLIGATGILLEAGRRSDPDYPGVVGPLDLGPVSRVSPAATALGVEIVFLLLVGLLGVALVSLVLRYRRATATVRAQLRWLLSAAAGIVGVLVIGLGSELLGFTGQRSVPFDDATDALLELSLLAVPVAIAVAVTRHGLFEIDRVVSRTVSYAVVVGLLALVYVGVVTSVSTLLPARLGSVPVVAATLAVAALFVPVRRRVLRVVDQRFNRRRYDAERVLAAFTTRLRARPDGEDIPQDLLEVLYQTVQPGHASLWLAPTGSRR